MKKGLTREILGFVIFLLGAVFLINYQTSITGSFLGSKSTTDTFSFLFGLGLLILSIILFSSSLTLERRVEISSSIKQNPGLLKLTQEAVKDPVIEREMNHLIKELSKGNFEAGLGHPGHIDGTKIHYLRGRNGARLYYCRKGENDYEIVAKSAKGTNQEKVIDKLRNIYS